MENTFYDVIIVGAGHAGLCTSFYLTKGGIKHIVFEQGRIGETWRSQRWDSFKMNSANKLNLLPEQTKYFDDPDSFSFANEFASSLDNYVKQFNLSVVEDSRVVEVKRIESKNIFTVMVLMNKVKSHFECKQLVIASGGQNKLVIPEFSKNIASHILQLHSSEYRNVNQLLDGNILIVGSAQSGIQIAEDLVRENRKVFLSTGMVGRIPRRYRGKDIYDWLFELGFYDVFTEDVMDLSLFKSKNPQVSGWGERGKTCSLQSLSRKGVSILGRVDKADSNTVFIQPNAISHVLFADDFSKNVKVLIDDYIRNYNIEAALPEIDNDDIPDLTASCVEDISMLHLSEHNIKTIIWATGLIGDFNFLQLPVLSKSKIPKHHNGISDVKGLYFIGLPWLRKKKSSLIPGISDDAGFIVQQIIDSISN